MKKAFVIGITGGSASGKSTLSNALAKALCQDSDRSVLCLHMDEYFKPEEQRPRSVSPISGKTYTDDNHPMTMDLIKFRKDVIAASIDEKYDIIIAEGLLTLYDSSISELLDLKIFVYCRPDERIVRRIKRNTEWGQSFENITDVYLDLVRLRHDEYVEPTKWLADIIINGAGNTATAVNMITSYISTRIKQ